LNCHPELASGSTQRVSLGVAAPPAFPSFSLFSLLLLTAKVTKTLRLGSAVSVGYCEAVQPAVTTRRWRLLGQSRRLSLRERHCTLQQQTIPGQRSLAGTPRQTMCMNGRPWCWGLGLSGHAEPARLGLSVETTTPPDRETAQVFEEHPATSSCAGCRLTQQPTE
jgi:hypothetical protein